MMIHDRQITISVAGSRRAVHWQPQTLYISELYDKLRTPARGTETYEAYLALRKPQQDDLKDVGGYVAGSLRDGRRKAGSVTARDVLTLDIDSMAPGGTDDMLRRLSSLGCGYVVYSTRKHAPASPRLRVLLPLDRTVTADEYEPIARKAAQLIDPSMQPFDPSTFEASRLMYWPSCCADSTYIFTCEDKPLLSAAGMLATYSDWRDMASWPEVPGAQQAHVRLAARQADPCAKPGVVGAFCRVYDVPAALDRFLPGVYEPADNLPGRYTFTGGSTAGGAVLYDGGKYLYSHHATDPAGGRLCNAFDLVRLHLYGGMDDDAKPDTPSNKLPSYTAMCEQAVQDPNIAGLLNTERYAAATKDFSGVQADNGDAPANWMSLLAVSPTTGAPAKTTDNILLILEHDPLLRGRIGLDAFASRGAVMDTLPWDAGRPGRRPWEDSDDAGVRWYMEKTYNITGEKKVQDALAICGRRHTFDDVRDYLQGLAWDGVSRLDTLLVDYLGAADTPYTRAITRKAFAAAAARVISPGIKFDNMLILTGAQGVGKSTLVRKMGREWYTDGIKTFEGKEAAEIIQGMWLVEIGELEALNRSEIGRVKQFLSQGIDRYREAYGRHAKDCPRRCVFFGTSNNNEYLRDTTGNRRFWPVDVGVIPATKSVFRDLDSEVGQLWAEALMRWQLGEALYLIGAEAQSATDEQEKHRETSAREGLILDFIGQDIPEGWSKWSLDRRRMYWAGNVLSAGAELVPRRVVCALEIWCEVFGGNAKELRRSDTQEINAVLATAPEWKRMPNAGRFGYCGVQKGFEKV